MGREQFVPHRGVRECFVHVQAVYTRPSPFSRGRGAYMYIQGWNTKYVAKTKSNTVTTDIFHLGRRRPKQRFASVTVNGPPAHIH